MFEFLHLIEPLPIPGTFGGDAQDAFTVIVPSLPGYGFSGKPTRPIGPRTVARLFDKLMTDMLALAGLYRAGRRLGLVYFGLDGL